MVTIDRLDNGLTVITEEMPHFESVSFDVVMSGGLASDSEERQGLSVILPELTERGAGRLSSRELTNAFESRGIRRGASAGLDRFVYRANALHSEIGEAIRLCGMMILEPSLPPEELEPIRSVLLQDIASLEDNPAAKVSVELAQRYFPQPFGRSGYGTEAGLQAVTMHDLRDAWTTMFRPDGAVFSAAGKIRRSDILKMVEDTFGRWQGRGVSRPVFGALPPHAKVHIHADSAQTQIALGYPSAKFGDRHYYTAKVVNEVLSGGMFGRLFIEVREKRGLCYSVHSRHAGGVYAGSLFAYAGTTPERARETLEVMTSVLQGMDGSLSKEELDRAKSNLKASLIIGGESPGSRASSNAGDWWLDGRVRTLKELSDAVDAVTGADIDEYCRAFPATSYMLVTLGREPLVA